MLHNLLVWKMCCWVSTVSLLGINSGEVYFLKFLNTFLKLVLAGKKKKKSLHIHGSAGEKEKQFSAI